MQATVLEAVLPLWADPQLAKLPRLHVIVVRILTQVRPSVHFSMRPHWSLLGCLRSSRHLARGSTCKSLSRCKLSSCKLRSGQARPSVSASKALHSCKHAGTMVAVQRLLEGCPKAC